ncbi:MAG: oligoendopeptidase F, partial [Eubacteriales bacterium]|nr:oligoendopeptidase F [Eubacteriales bacterium]
MSEETIRSRSEIPESDKWNIETMYKTREEWEKDRQEAISSAEAFPEKYRGKLGESAEILADALTEDARIEQITERVFVYAHQKLDEDNRNSTQQEMNGLALDAAARVQAASSFLIPEILEIPEETLLKYQKEDPRLADYAYEFKTLLREKAHILSPEEEHLMARLGEVLDGSDQVFTMLNDADLKFGTIQGEDGNPVEVTHGNYIKLMRSKNRDVRKNAFEACYRMYQSHINTISANYGLQVKTDVIRSKIRKYPSSRAMALSSGNIPESVYDNLIEEVHAALPAMYRYIAKRRKILGVDKLKMYDVYVPLVEIPEREYSFEDAVELGKKGLAPLGQEYLDQFQRGIDERWIDIYENEGKTRGAYSFGSYDSAPFVLMNFSGTLDDVFTLVHEMGHSMNSYYTRKTQPFIYGDHSIFTAEVASTVNETLLMRYLLKTEKNPNMRKYILNLYLEAFRTTLFRQTMFAEFEKKTHEFVEEGGSLTADFLCGEYEKLNQEYFG